MQVLEQWKSVRAILLKYAKGLHPTQEGAWRTVLKMQPISSIEDVFKLYVLYQLIATQSADVERGFSILNDTLGLKRMSTHTQTVDARLRIKQALPSKPDREQLQWIGSQPAAEVATPTPWSIYSEQLKPSRPDMLFKSLHEVVSMEKDTFWAEVMGAEFSTLEGFDCSGDEEEDVDEPVQSIEELAALLEHGLVE
jgi:hypothetical protein